MSEQKKYAKGIFIKQTSEFYTNININLANFNEWAKEFADEKGYIKLTIGKKKEVGKFGDTHWCALNEWKPESQSNDKYEYEAEKYEPKPEDEVELPF